ncbi:PREDICTED: SAYSvFN domain-containing protein 1-like [Priapulus caudatus]|uniref:SAYSvFN domain-containing protein 1-like n=1 Tax=Priapulus caudatus TaxID=37621 RepID=A0ABM1EDB8_PRICU|nr:PREDICTED: SAYSvFN domain-containing protein 1-like [Priapulus caudatus]
MEVEAKLASYRAKKAQPQRYSYYKELFSSITLRKPEQPTNDTHKEASSAQGLNQETSEGGSTPTCADIETPRSDSSWFSAITILKFLLWIILLGLFIELEFAGVYLVASLFAFVYLNTRTGVREGPSAYSVFNRDFERIDGTFTAEEFDQRIRRGGFI